jgi:cutinase
MSGYSQGAQVVHKAADKLTADVSNKITAGECDEMTTVCHGNEKLIAAAPVMLFGDPDLGDAVGTISPSRVNTICHDGDNICDGGIIVTSAHTNYQQDVNTAADFITKMVQ